MPLFTITNNDGMYAVEQTNFETEKMLKRMVENNLVAIFNCRFVASEFSTGAKHAGRIDTLALSEDNNPVIIEYKKIESSELINQSLFYLSWIHDHRGDFEIAAMKSLGPSIEVDWSDVRVICIAPGYKKYDLHAVQVMGANIELWRYRLFVNSTIYFEEIFRQTYPNESASVQPEIDDSTKNPVMVAAGKKAALTRATGSYTFEQHIEGKTPKISQLAVAIQEFIFSLDSAIEQNPKKLYVAYKISQNIVCMEIRKQHITLYLKLRPSDVVNPPSNYRDVAEIGHYGTGDTEFIIKNEADIEITKPFIEMAYRKIGG